MQHSESIASLAGALAKAQLQIESAIKNAQNPHFRSHYADLASIWDACRKPLNSNGLSVVQLPCDGENARVGLCTMIMHMSGEWISEIVTCKPQKDDPQGLGSALTYLRRYALGAIVGVTTCEDDDGNAASIAPIFSKTALPVAVQPPVSSRNKELSDHAEATLSTFVIVDFVKVDNATSPKNGKPYTKYRIGWSNDAGERTFGTTFSHTTGEAAANAKKLGKKCEVTYVTGQYGIDIKSIVLVSNHGSETESMGEIDEIPF